MNFRALDTEASLRPCIDSWLANNIMQTVGFSVECGLRDDDVVFFQLRFKVSRNGKHLEYQEIRNGWNNTPFWEND